MEPVIPENVGEVGLEERIKATSVGMHYTFLIAGATFLFLLPLALTLHD